MIPAPAETLHAGGHRGVGENPQTPDFVCMFKAWKSGQCVPVTLHSMDCDCPGALRVILDIQE